VQAAQQTAPPVERITQAAEPAARVPRAVPQEAEDDKPKRLVRRDDPPENPRSAALPPAPLSVDGKLHQIDCLGKVARLRVRAGQKEVVLAITEPETVVLKNAPTGTLDLTCGAQKDNHLTIEYESRPDAKLGTIGVVRSIEYH